MKKWKTYLALAALLGGTIAIGAGIDQKIRTDRAVQGIASSTDDKVYEFDTGDGASNVNLTVDDTRNVTLDTDGSTTLKSDAVIQGDGTATDKSYKWDTGDGVNNPGFRYDATTDTIFHRTVGKGEKSIGSGAGGGGGINLLVDDNFDFESDAVGGEPSIWVASVPANFTGETANPLFGAQSGSWDASSVSETLDSATKTMGTDENTEGLKGASCLAQISYKWETGTTGHYTLSVYDGTADITTPVDLVPTSGIVKTVFVVFNCPSSGTIRLRLTATNASATAITLDNAHLGSNLREVQFGTAEFAGSSYYPTTASCTWSVSNNGGPATMGTTAACPGPTIDNALIGDWQTTDDDLPTQTINNLPPGIYHVVAQHPMQASTVGTVINTAISDGSTTGRHTSFIQSTSGHAPVVTSAWFVYTSTVSKTFEIFVASGAGSQNLSIDTPNRQLKWSVTRYPLQSETAQSIDSANFFISANMGGDNPSIGTSALSSYTELTAAALDLVVNEGSALQACSSTEESSGTTCSGNESVGISFVVPRIGWYETCATYTVEGANTNGAAMFQLVETPNNAQTISQEGKGKLGYFSGGTGTVDTPHHLCGWFEFTSVGKKTIRLMREQTITAGSGIIVADRQATVGQRDMHWTVRKISDQNIAIQLKDLLNTPGADRPKVLSAEVTCTGSPTTDRELGDPLNGNPSQNSTGNCTATFTAGKWTAVPFCQVTANVSAASNDIYCQLDSQTPLSTTTIRWACYDGGVAANHTAHISCHGE